jgi:hypothetical protein
MPTQIYKLGLVHTIDGQEIEIIPLKIKYLREFMDLFSKVKEAATETEALERLVECVRVAMKQYKPDLAKSSELIEDNFDLYNIYQIMDFAAGIKLTENTDQTVSEQIAEDPNNTTWESLDLVKLETEVFLLGIWKNYEELELSISIQELMSIISNKRDLDYQERKFFAAIQGIDLDGGASEDGKERGQKEWEDLKARVFSRGQTQDSNDVLALQGPNAQKYGFGIGMGLDYQTVKG